MNSLKEILLSDGAKTFDNATLERVRHIDTTVRRSPQKNNSPMPMGGGGGLMPGIEESCESILDVSDLSFDETADLLGDSRRNMTANKRRSSGRFEQAQKRRKSRSMGTKLDGDMALKVSGTICSFISLIS